MLLEVRTLEHVPLLLPASLNAASPRMIPKQSWVKRGTILPWLASGLWMVSFDPEAVTICCSFVPENCPNTADVIEEGGWIVRLYMNIELVVAMVSDTRRLVNWERERGQTAAATGWEERTLRVAECHAVNDDRARATNQSQAQRIALGAAFEACEQARGAKNLRGFPKGCSFDAKSRGGETAGSDQ